MYRLEFLPIAKKDMDDIIYYISNNLKKKTAARNLANNFIKGANSILEFPYGSSAYKTLKNWSLNIEFLKLKIFSCFIL